MEVADMMIKAVRANEDNFKKYGLYYDLYKTSKQKSGDGWKCSTSDYDFEYQMPFGYVEVRAHVPFVVDSMERNSRSKEMQIVGGKPIVLAVANTQGDAPRAEDVEAFILYPGDVIVLDVNIWHDASYSLFEETYYYYFSQDDPSANFIPLQEGKTVLVT